MHGQISKQVRQPNLLLLCVLFITMVVGLSCQAGEKHAGNDYLAIAKANEVELELFEKDKHCSVRIKGADTTADLNIPYPCGFVRADAGNNAQSQIYKNVGRVFVVAGPSADPEAYGKNAGVNPIHFCSNQGQAIIVQDGKIFLRKAQTIPLGFCHHLGFDEKDYYAYAFPVD